MVISDIYNYDNGYIGLITPFDTDAFPKTIDINNQELSLKSEFHISLINAGKVAALIDKNKQQQIENEIVEEFKDFITKLSLENYKVTKKFRFVERDERKTIIVIAEVPNLDKFFEKLRQKYGKDIPSQPTHITLYTLQPERGIGIFSENELNNESRQIELTEFDNLRFVKRLQ
jgi:hypothetical protein